MTARRKDMEAMILGKFVRDHVAQEFAPLRAKIMELETRIQNFTYCGVYESGRNYDRGNFCTHDGSMWHANCATASKPGIDAAWSLCVKRGKNAR